MKIKPLIVLAGLTTALGLSLVITSADAQGRRAGGRGGAPAAGPNGAVDPMQLQIQMQMGGGLNIVDPAQSAKSTLVYRTDVQNTLMLDLKQKLALDDLKTVQAQNQGKLGLEMRTLVQGLRGPGAQNLTPDDQQQKMQEITDKLKGESQGYQDNMDKRIDAILTPKQQTRLSELDLQWRGPLALVDPKVADKAMLGADDKKKAADAYKEFTDARQKLMLATLPAGMRNRLANTTGGAATGAAAGGTTDGSAPPAAPTLAAVPLTPAEQAAAQQKAFQDFNKSCTTMATKLVSNLTPAAATAWQGMLGSHFAFRNDQ